jgi:hypothetical protein
MRYSLTVALAATNDMSSPMLGDEAAVVTHTFRDGSEQRITGLFPWAEALVVDADTTEATVETVFRAANIGEDGWAARYRAGRQRSLSVGDVVIVAAESGRVTVWQVLPFGLGELPLAEVAPLLKESPWSFEAADAVADPSIPRVARILAEDRARA